NAGPRNVVVITTDCTGVGSCGGAASTTCRQVSAPGLEIVTRDLETRLSFQFPDTDDLLAPDADDRTFSGPATIAVTLATDPLPCGLVSGTCSGQSGLVACIDDFFTSDGTCGTALPQGTFNHFTALPPPNDYQAACFDEVGPCAPASPELRLTTDQAGNVLLP